MFSMLIYRKNHRTAKHAKNAKFKALSSRSSRALRLNLVFFTLFLTICTVEKRYPGNPLRANLFYHKGDNGEGFDFVWYRRSFFIILPYKARNEANLREQPFASAHCPG